MHNLCAECGAEMFTPSELKRGLCWQHGGAPSDGGNEKVFDVALGGDPGEGGFHSHSYRIRHWARWDDDSLDPGMPRDSIDGEVEVSNWELVGQMVEQLMTHISGSGFTVKIEIDAIS